MQDLVAILHKDGVTSNIERTLSELDTDKDGRLAFSELQNLNTLYPTILYPAFKIQHTLQGLSKHLLVLSTYFSKHQLQQNNTQMRSENVGCRIFL